MQLNKLEIPILFSDESHRDMIPITITKLLKIDVPNLSMLLDIHILFKLNWHIIAINPYRTMIITTSSVRCFCLPSKSSIGIACRLVMIMIRYEINLGFLKLRAKPVIIMKLVNHSTIIRAMIPS